MYKHIYWTVKQICWSHVLGAESSGLSVAFEVLAPMPPCSSPCWCAMGWESDLRSRTRGFNSASRLSYVTTLEKLFQPMCLCHQPV